jgi:hypothetical protein
MEGGKVVARHCVPTESIVEFGDLPFQALVIERRGSSVVVLRLPARATSRPAWRTFHFTAADCSVRDLAGGVTAHRWATNVIRDDNSDSVVEPYKVTRPGRWLYTIYVGLPKPPAQAFEFLLPPRVIVGREVQFPPIRFERKSWMGISPFNC